MEKFILSGQTNVGEKLLLRLPSAKTFETVALKNVESETYPKELITKVVLRRKEIICQHEKSHVSPSAVINNKYQKLQKTLYDLLNAHQVGWGLDEVFPSNFFLNIGNPQAYLLTLR